MMKAPMVLALTEKCANTCSESEPDLGVAIIKSSSMPRAAHRRPHAVIGVHALTAAPMNDAPMKQGRDCSHGASNNLFTNEASLTLVPIIVAKTTTMNALDVKVLVTLLFSFTSSRVRTRKRNAKSGGSERGHNSWREGCARAFQSATLPFRRQIKTSKKDDAELAGTPRAQAPWQMFMILLDCACRLSVSCARTVQVYEGGRARTQRSGL
jgi:hypothetical protein